MKAAVNTKYGPAHEVVHIEDVARPEIDDNQILIKVYTTSVSTGVWRMVEMNAKGVLGIAARLIFGITRPRNTIQGGSFAGRVVSIGSAVTKFKLGDAVFGTTGSGAHAEYLAMSEDKGVAKMPASLGFDEAAAIPFGGLSALVFLRDFAQLQPGQRVLVTGASGGVGVFGVQIAKAMGATVTGLTSTDNVELVRALGADHVVDYKQTDFLESSTHYDVIFDTAGITTFAKAKHLLRPSGLFVPLEFGVPEMLRSYRPDSRGRRVIVGVNGDHADDLIALAEMADRGKLRPVIDCHVPLDRIHDAYQRVASRHKRGAVIVTVDQPKMHGQAAA